MHLKWTDSFEIALALLDEYPEVDPRKIRFTDLREWILNLEDFDDDPNHCGERILEAVQMAWIEESD
ncbi:Fe-S cluster assembly protein IscX [Pseudoalteromonas sp.]|uniref:Fe-S cluster assembly protein IscX n=1 Tax=Pseudoalteromonas sp. TaxID=53249 RepID=UPI0035690A15